MKEIVIIYYKECIRKLQQHFKYKNMNKDLRVEIYVLIIVFFILDSIHYSMQRKNIQDCIILKALSLEGN
ncbi:hypothetical protein C922_05473 [Plasmodium inui San Antonio 1]|uniref:Uncharacterized protein n=1 Tax=Plasmodium inui San Antonio 1 TaxID=1237626 RepID=W6ZXW3_9APIC|nr:hypothetical protein C922_05473 [Plasmodium inui San Antonio 1]EUD64143.1 hypothetical protein C922_05473 [Plasmodium inui San Antonio 1]